MNLSGTSWKVITAYLGYAGGCLWRDLSNKNPRVDNTMMFECADCADRCLSWLLRFPLTGSGGFIHHVTSYTRCTLSVSWRPFTQIRIYTILVLATVPNPRFSSGSGVEPNRTGLNVALQIDKHNCVTNRGFLTRSIFEFIWPID